MDKLTERRTARKIPKKKRNRIFARERDLKKPGEGLEKGFRE